LNAVKQDKPSRPKPVPISDQMKAWSAALVADTADWPQVKPRSFFGFTGLYRKDFMFAVLPRTRSMETPDAIAFRLDAPAASLRARLSADARISSAEIKEARWFAFTLSRDAELHDALDWLGRAYDAAAQMHKAKKRR
jgi:hypothetical protein